MLQAFQTVESAGWLYRNAPHFGEIALEATGVPHERAAGAHGGDEVGEASASLVDDFGAGMFEVRLPVGRIVVLIGVEVAIRVGIVDFAAETDGAVGASAASL